jgi:hypothetical protein
MAKSHVKLISGISLKLSTHFPHMSTAGIAYFPHMSTAGIAYFPHMSAADIAYFPHMSAADIACCGVGGWFFAGDIKGCGSGCWSITVCFGRGSGESYSCRALSAAANELSILIC